MDTKFKLFDDDEKSDANAPPSYNAVSMSPISGDSVKCRPPSVFSKEQTKQIRTTVLSLIRDVVTTPDFVPSSVGPIFDACAASIPAGEFSDILQESNIEGHTPLYWAIVNSRPEAISALSCMVTSDHALFMKLKLTSCSCYPTEIQVYGGDKQNEFTAKMQIRMFQTRMRVAQEMCVELIAQGRIWGLLFHIGVDARWKVSLYLAKHSLPACPEALLTVQPRNEQHQALEMQFKLEKGCFLVPRGYTNYSMRTCTYISASLGDWLMFKLRWHLACNIGGDITVVLADSEIRRPVMMQKLEMVRYVTISHFFVQCEQNVNESTSSYISVTTAAYHTKSVLSLKKITASDYLTCLGLDLFMSDTQPAHHTKHLPVLAYPANNVVFHLVQRDDGISNGTALWLGAQVLSVYLSAEFKGKSRTIETGTHNSASVLYDTARPKAIELGSGIGLMALALASIGYDVLATDTMHVCASVLRSNINANAHLVPGHVHVRELDWGVDPMGWKWDDHVSITSPTPLSKKGDDNCDFLAPPFDLIVSSDTIYDTALVAPLFETIRALSALSSTFLSPPSSLSGVEASPVPPSKSPETPTCKPPVIYLAVERRDPTLITAAFRRAGEEWGLLFQRVPEKRLRRAGVGVGWDAGEWEGVEVWRGRWDGVTRADK
ncbi:uncharacterized protein EDB93DRAFT_1100544 [Suillus bovinus]|uniref:uncharacterized protein n=1 Tax=Suillus bovinus TaxID=48563 RepID=UPI001B867190|nr:uncharacterized protein EDB93DRAFT_1100544 [Suillus bovinus]KAG2158347.1 hypothetical protein EDB93DRAFT_1100544 [Suillus bovinus]